MLSLRDQGYNDPLLAARDSVKVEELILFREKVHFLLENLLKECFRCLSGHVNEFRLANHTVLKGLGFLTLVS